MAGRVGSYPSYLGLDELLSLQQPATPQSDARIWAAERFFIVCHQTSELWVSQIFVDLAGANGSAEAGDWAASRVSLTRASSLVALLHRNLTELLYLPVEDFLRFRDALDGTSGAESRQFVALLGGPSHPAVLSIAAAVAAALPTVAPDVPHPEEECTHDVCAVAAALDALLSSIGIWRRLHAQVALHFIGDLPGTGGTSGVRYLLRRAGETAGQTEVVPRSRPLSPDPRVRPRAGTARGPGR
jgi:tryptophan 2,3-dioxygenase